MPSSKESSMTFLTMTSKRGLHAPRCGHARVAATRISDSAVLPAYFYWPVAPFSAQQRFGKLFGTHWNRSGWDPCNRCHHHGHCRFLLLHYRCLLRLCHRHLQVPRRQCHLYRQLLRLYHRHRCHHPKPAGSVRISLQQRSDGLAITNSGCPCMLAGGRRALRSSSPSEHRAMASKESPSRSWIVCTLPVATCFCATQTHPTS